MRNKFLVFLSVVSVSIFAWAAWADSAQAQDVSSSSARASNLGATGLRGEQVAIRPEIGFLNYQNDIGDSSTTATVGILADLNASNVFNIGSLKNSDWYAGASTGLFYARVGTLGSTFLSLPIDLKMGYLLLENMRVGIHGGGDATYRSTGTQMQLSAAPSTTNAQVDFFPNAGADLDYAITNNLVASFRPDIIFNSGKDIFSATFSLTIPLSSG